MACRRSLSPLRVLRPTAAPKHTGTVIFFHGSGDTGESCEEFGVAYPMRRKFDFPHLKVIFPTAPLQPYTPMCGEKSNVWFDRVAISSKVPENLKSIEGIRDLVKDLIAKENEDGIPNERIIVGGISMGGALALYTGLLWENSLAGIFAMSSFLNDGSYVYKYLQDKKPKTPKLIQFHGEMDDLVPISTGRETFENLKALGVDGEFLVDDYGEHMPNKSQLHKVHSWIENLLPPL